MFKVADDRTSQPSLFTAPLLVDEAARGLFGNAESISLCYQVHGRASRFFSLVSDACVSVNAKYDRQRNHISETLLSQVGILGIDDNQTCVRVQVDAASCQVRLNGVPISNNYQRNGLSVTQLADGVRVVLPNCEFRDVVIRVRCGRLPANGQEQLELYLSRMLNFRATSHGLIGILLFTLPLCVPCVFFLFYP